MSNITVPMLLLGILILASHDAFGKTRRWIADRVTSAPSAPSAPQQTPTDTATPTGVQLA